MTAVDYIGRVVGALEKLQIAYMVVGSFSSNVYGLPRSTEDADFVVELGNCPLSSLLVEIGGDYVLEPQISFETITGTTRYRLTHTATVFVVELFLLSNDPHDRERFDRRIVGDVGGGGAFLPTAEDVIITKLRWSLHGNRSKDIDDVRSVIAVQAGKLDLTYIRRWTTEHGTGELLEKLLKEVGL